MKSTVFVVLVLLGTSLSANAGVKILGSADAEATYDIMDEAKVLQDLPRTFFGELTELSCNHDSVAAGKNAPASEIDSCEAFSLSNKIEFRGDTAAKLLGILSQIAPTEEFPGATYVKVKSLSCTLDYYNHSERHNGLICSVEFQ